MAKQVQEVSPPRSDGVKKWLKENIAEQKKRHKAIMKEMNVDFAPKRAKLYDQFFERIKTRGFNVHFTERRQITEEEIPKQHRKDKVVW